METIFINSKPEAKIASEITARFGYNFSPDTFYKRETMNVLNGLPESRKIGTEISSKIKARRDRTYAQRKLVLRDDAKPATEDMVQRIAEKAGLPYNFVESQMYNYDLDRCDAAGVVASMKVDYSESF